MKTDLMTACLWKCTRCHTSPGLLSPHASQPQSRARVPEGSRETSASPMRRNGMQQSPRWQVIHVQPRYLAIVVSFAFDAGNREMLPSEKSIHSWSLLMLGFAQETVQLIIKRSKIRTVRCWTVCLRALCSLRHPDYKWPNILQHSVTVIQLCH